MAMLLKADLLQHLALQMLVMVLYQALCGACVGEHRGQRSGKGVLNGYSSTGVSPWDSRMFGRLAMGFANVRASRYGIRLCSGGYSSTKTPSCGRTNCYDDVGFADYLLECVRLQYKRVHEYLSRYGIR